MAMVEVSSQRLMNEKVFSVPKFVRLARMSHHSHRLLRKMLRAVPENRNKDLSGIWGKEILSLEKENSMISKCKIRLGRQRTTRKLLTRMI